ncbi:MAG TPA: LmbE family protein [Phycisphaerales bacterium]|nr:MAG: LmbE family protein [Planctomycetes bacterium GWC2_45_44]HBG77726.1 LmbE family protein [Phycisphaerales bacterium]HBR20414.1 LmbE family protein [Phycisphaerales bacterium]
MNKTVLSFLCHPDDTEFMCAGTLALLKAKGWDIHIATMTPGDCGSTTHSREEISKIRRKESANAAAVLDGHYHCNELEDVFVMYDKPSLTRTIEIIRKVKPTIVFTASPQDYFIDHENTSHLVRTACFACGIPNVETPGAKAYSVVPYLYYADPLEGKDIFGSKIDPKIIVDITSVIETKGEMLSRHKSQRDWLLAHHGMDEYIESMKRFAAGRGSQNGCKYAEGFRQHLGSSYPQDNILKAELENLVTEKQ